MDITRWQPLSVPQTVELMTGLEVAWWIAGGWAIDLFLNRSTRHHVDIDVLVLRKDQVSACRHLSRIGWDLWAVDRPGHLRPIEPAKQVESSIHDIWCRPNGQAAWALQLMLAESSGERWLYRRDPEVSLQLSEVGFETVEGIPYVAPQVELLFKSMSPRPQDEADFTLTVPELPPAARRWLASAISSADPLHPWLARLHPTES